MLADHHNHGDETPFTVTIHTHTKIIIGDQIHNTTLQKLHDNDDELVRLHCWEIQEKNKHEIQGRNCPQTIVEMTQSPKGPNNDLKIIVTTTTIKPPVVIVSNKRAIGRQHRKCG